MSDAKATLVTEMRRRLGRVGVWSNQLRVGPAAEDRALARRVEALGYGSLWTGEIIGGKDVFAEAAVCLAATEKLVFGSGIANLWARHPAAMIGGAATLGAAWPGRFVNGIGVSHSIIIDASGQHYAKPLSRMQQYLADMDAAAALAPDADPPVPRVLAALGPKMLELAREAAHGAHPYLVPPSHTPIARGILGPDRLLIPEQKVVLQTDPAEARRIGRQHIDIYLGLPNYVNNLKALGYGDDLGGGGSDRLVDALVAWGDEAAIARRVRELRDSGADHVLLQVLADDTAGALAQLEALAPALLGVA